MAVDYITKWVEAKVLWSITPTKIKDLSTRTSFVDTKSPTSSYQIMEHSSTAMNSKSSAMTSRSRSSRWSRDPGPMARWSYEQDNQAQPKDKAQKPERKMDRRSPRDTLGLRTTTRSMTRETPFSLAYRYKAMILVELGAGSLRRDNFDSEQNIILQWCELNFLEEKRHESQLQVATYQDAQLDTSTRKWRQGDFKKETSSSEEFYTTKGP